MKNIILCSDGTGKTGIKGRRTNVVKLFEAEETDQDRGNGLKTEETDYDGGNGLNTEGTDLDRGNGFTQRNGETETGFSVASFVRVNPFPPLSPLA